VKVIPYGELTNYIGTYGIVYSTGTARP